MVWRALLLTGAVVLPTGENTARAQSSVGWTRPSSPLREPDEAGGRRDPGRWRPELQGFGSQPASYYYQAAEDAGGAASEGAGGDNGTNPAQNVRTVIVTNEFYRLDNGNEVNTTYLRFKFPMLEQQGSLLVEVPFNHYDIQAPVNTELGGLGDVKFQTSYNFCSTDDRQLTFISFLEFFIPSADTFLLTGRGGDANDFLALSVGTGRYVLGPGLGMVYAPAPNMIIAPLYFYEFDIAGDDARQDIDRGKLRFFMMYACPSGHYLLPEAQVVTNFLDGDNDVYVAPEIGYSHQGATFYVKPGLGIDPDPNDRQWGVEFGMRLNY